MGPCDFHSDPSDHPLLLSPTPLRDDHLSRVLCESCPECLLKLRKRFKTPFGNFSRFISLVCEYRQKFYSGMTKTETLIDHRLVGRSVFDNLLSFLYTLSRKVRDLLSVIPWHKRYSSPCLLLTGCQRVLKTDLREGSKSVLVSFGFVPYG